MIKKVTALAILTLISFNVQADNAFAFWQKEQVAYADQNLATIATEKVIEDVRAAATKNKSSYFPSSSSQLQRLYKNIEQANSSFISQLEEYFSHPSMDKEDLAAKHPVTVKKYHTALASLFPVKDRDQALFNAANRMFRYCFSQKTFPHFNKLMSTAQSYPLVRFVYSSIWSQFCDKASIHWSDECLRNLEKLSDEGKSITYIDGGYDIYQLLKSKIYNIHIINPTKLTPANSEIRKLHLYMVDKKTEIVTITLSGETVTLKRTINRPGRRQRWSVSVNGERKGTIAIEQRAVEQKDLGGDSIILCSFRGMVNLVKPKLSGGWDLHAGLLPPEKKIYVKQLHKPVSPNILMNVRVAQTMNHIDLKFIDLAAEPMQRNYPAGTKGAL